jgi:hypothetical protein
MFAAKQHKTTCPVFPTQTEAGLLSAKCLPIGHQCIISCWQAMGSHLAILAALILSRRQMIGAAQRHRRCHRSACHFREDERARRPDVVLTQWRENPIINAY